MAATLCSGLRVDMMFVECLQLLVKVILESRPNLLDVVNELYRMIRDLATHAFENWTYLR